MEEANDDNVATILVVDDISANVRVLVSMLQEKEYNIAVATDGRKALELAEDVLPDLILLDISMPEMDGFQVCEALKSREETKDIPVIFLTGRAQTEDIIRGFAVGAVDYVTKPFSRAELLARVNTQIHLREAQREIITLNQKIGIMAMAVTTNHEICQPLTVLQGNFEMFRQIRNKENMEEKKEKLLCKMQKSIDTIKDILKKFSSSDHVQIQEYLDDVTMVVFDGEYNEL